MTNLSEIKKAIFKALQPKKTVREQVKDAVQHNVKRALHSPYDSKVSVMAVGSASGVIEAIDNTLLDDEKYLDTIIERLTQLRKGYYDEAGEYTSGKGEIGDLLRDIIIIKNEIAHTHALTEDSFKRKKK